MYLLWHIWRVCRWGPLGIRPMTHATTSVKPNNIRPRERSTGSWFCLDEKANLIYGDGRRGYSDIICGASCTSLSVSYASIKLPFKNPSARDFALALCQPFCPALYNINTCVCVCVCDIFIRSAIDGHLGGLLQITLQWTWVCMYLFQWSFLFSDKNPGVELLGHMVALFLIFWGNLILFSLVVVPIHIPPTVHKVPSSTPTPTLVMLTFW